MWPILHVLHEYKKCNYDDAAVAAGATRKLFHFPNKSKSRKDTSGKEQK